MSVQLLADDPRYPVIVALLCMFFCVRTKRPHTNISHGLIDDEGYYCVYYSSHRAFFIDHYHCLAHDNTSLHRLLPSTPQLLHYTFDLNFCYGYCQTLLIAGKQVTQYRYDQNSMSSGHLLATALSHEHISSCLTLPLLVQA